MQSIKNTLKANMTKSDNLLNLKDKSKFIFFCMRAEVGRLNDQQQSNQPQHW